MTDWYGFTSNDLSGEEFSCKHSAFAGAVLSKNPQMTISDYAKQVGFPFDKEELDDCDGEMEATIDAIFMQCFLLDLPPLLDPFEELTMPIREIWVKEFISSLKKNGHPNAAIFDEDYAA